MKSNVVNLAPRTKIFHHFWVLVSTHAFDFFLHGRLSHLECERHLSKSQVLCWHKPIQEDVDSYKKIIEM